MLVFTEALLIMRPGSETRFWRPIMKSLFKMEPKNKRNKVQWCSSFRFQLGFRIDITRNLEMYLFYAVFIKPIKLILYVSDSTWWLLWVKWAVLYLQGYGDPCRVADPRIKEHLWHWCYDHQHLGHRHDNGGNHCKPLRCCSVTFLFHLCFSALFLASDELLWFL